MGGPTVPVLSTPFRKSSVENYVDGHLGRRAAYFDLRANLLQACGKRFNLLCCRAMVASYFAAVASCPAISCSRKAKVFLRLP
jgi:hypothetical protein